MVISYCENMEENDGFGVWWNIKWAPLLCHWPRGNLSLLSLCFPFFPFLSFLLHNTILLLLLLDFSSLFLLFLLPKRTLKASHSRLEVVNWNAYSMLSQLHKPPFITPLSVSVSVPTIPLHGSWFLHLSMTPFCPAAWFFRPSFHQAFPNFSTPTSLIFHFIPFWCNLLPIPHLNLFSFLFLCFSLARRITHSL